jgi:hypothetical protein
LCTNIKIQFSHIIYTGRSCSFPIIAAEVRIFILRWKIFCAKSIQIRQVEQRLYWCECTHA